MKWSQSLLWGTQGRPLHDGPLWQEQYFEVKQSTPIRFRKSSLLLPNCLPLSGRELPLQILLYLQNLST